MSTREQVKEFLKNALPEARRQNISKMGLAVFLSKYGISIKGVEIRGSDDFKPHLLVEFINDDDKIEEAHFDLVEVDGRSLEEIQKELIENENAQ